MACVRLPELGTTILTDTSPIGIQTQWKWTLYTKPQGNIDTLILCIYVDDIMYMGSSQEMLYQFRTNKMQTYEMTDLRLLKYFLGLEVKQGNEYIFVSQKKYAEDL